MQKLNYLQGSIERVTFHNEETGFSVLRIKAKEQRELVTVIGNTASLNAGEDIELQGHWINDKKYGIQFKAQQIISLQPTSLEGIERYLGSGMIKGVGPFYAKKLVKVFGQSVFDIIEHHPDRLTEVEGIGKKRQKIIANAWTEQKSVRKIMVFLQSHGIGTARCARIHKNYGDNAIDMIRENPYRLALDIRGIGFKTADTLASRLGIAKDSIIRAQAGVHHVLQKLCGQGHCAAELEKLISACSSLLSIPDPTIKQAIDLELQDKKIILDSINDIACIFPISYYKAEIGVSKHLQRLSGNKLPWDQINIENAIPWVEEKNRLKLSESQKQAIRIVLNSKIAVITGGPGVGKTTLVNSILKILRAKKLAIALCAPTGRAAKRLTETTGLSAKTIHRLLEFDPQSSTFRNNHENPLALDVLVIDEASMIDISLMHHLLKAIPNHAAIFFVGDVDQLPSVGSGAVLTDLIRSNKTPIVKLTEIFRQAANSKIIINAHRINHGYMPLHVNSKKDDFYTFYESTSEKIHDRLVDIVTEFLPQHFNFDPVKDIQILTPMNRGGLGSIALNVTLQNKLNGHAEPKITRFGITFAPGDKVIQTINNYEKEIFNGDIGYISKINIEESLVQVSFDTRIIEYSYNELDELSLAYAISIPKSQGSEFRVVVIPLSMQHYTMLARNLLYTAITRGKKFVVLIGQKKAIGMAVTNVKQNYRLTKLAQRIEHSFM